jgi:hypothetical protein
VGIKPREVVVVPCLRFARYLTRGSFSSLGEFSLVLHQRLGKRDERLSYKGNKRGVE